MLTRVEIWRDLAIIKSVKHIQRIETKMNLIENVKKRGTVWMFFFVELNVKVKFVQHGLMIGGSNKKYFKRRKDG